MNCFVGSSWTKDSVELLWFHCVDENWNSPGFEDHKLGELSMCGALNQKIRERVQEKLSRFKCQEEVLKYVVGLERDIHFLRMS